MLNNGDFENQETQPLLYDSEENDSNIVTGVVGATLGALLGVALWVIVSMMGYIAGICGVAMLLAGFKGYELLGGTLDTKGMVTCVLISIIMIFVAVNVSLIAEIIKEFGYATTQRVGFWNVLNLAWTDAETRRSLIFELIMGYVLYFISGFTYIKKAFAR